MIRRMHLSKVLLMLMVLIMIVSIVGCGQSKDPNTSKTDKTITQSTEAGSSANSSSNTSEQKPELYTIKYFANPKTVKLSDETEIGKVIKDKFNIVFEYVPYTGDYREKLNLMLAAGDYPDFLRLEREDIVKKYIDAGALVLLEDFLKDANNFTERYKDQIPYWRLSSPDNKLYKWEISVPQSKEVSLQNYDVLVRTDALEKQGWPKLQTTDDYLNFLKQAMKDIPTTNGKKTLGMVLPLAESWGMGGILPALFEKGEKYTAAAGNEGVIWNLKDKKYEHYLTNEYVKESFQFFNKLFREGILDKESFTDQYAQFEEKMNSGRPLSAWYCTWLAGSANPKLIQAGHPEQQYITLPIQSSTMVQRGEKRQITLEISRPFDSVAITKNAKDPKRIFQLVDWAASEEGQLLLQSGIEGKDYNIVDGKRVPAEAHIKYLQGENPGYDEKTGFAELFSLLGKVLTPAKDGLAYGLGMDPSIKDKISLTDRQKEAFSKLGWSNSTEWWIKNGVDSPVGLVSSITLEANSDLSKVYQKMTELRVKTSAKLVMAKSDEEFERIYKQMVEEYNKLEPQKVIDKFNEMMQENIKNLQ